MDEQCGCPIVGCDWKRAATLFFPPQFSDVIYWMAEYSFKHGNRLNPYTSPGRDLLVEQTGLSSATVSRRMAVMRKAGWLRLVSSGCADDYSWWELRIPR